MKTTFNDSDLTALDVIPSSLKSNLLGDIQWIDFGLADYESIYKLQLKLVKAVEQNQQPNTILLGQHHTVLTTGRGFKTENLLTNDIKVIEIERGGDITYHGPGQLVIYPILKLEKPHRDLHWLLRQMEEWIISSLTEFNIAGQRNEGWTGVWVSAQNAGSNNVHNEQALKKIASIGLAVKKWVSFHGIGFNVHTDKKAFNSINPCGLPASSMVNLQDLSPEATLEEVKQAFINHFYQVF